MTNFRRGPSYARRLTDDGLEHWLIRRERALLADAAEHFSCNEQTIRRRFAKLEEQGRAVSHVADDPSHRKVYTSPVLRPAADGRDSSAAPAAGTASPIPKLTPYEEKGLRYGWTRCGNKDCPYGGDGEPQHLNSTDVLSHKWLKANPRDYAPEKPLCYMCVLDILRPVSKTKPELEEMPDNIAENQHERIAAMLSDWSA